MNARVGFTRPLQFAFSKLASGYWEAGATVNITGCTMSGNEAKSGGVFSKGGSRMKERQSGKH